VADTALTSSSIATWARSHDRAADGLWRGRARELGGVILAPGDGARRRAGSAPV